MKKMPFERTNTQTSDMTSGELSLLLTVSRHLSSTLDLPEVLQMSIESIKDLLKLDTGAIYTLDDGYLFLGATAPPLPAEFPAELRIADLQGHPHIREAMYGKAAIYLEDARTAELSEAEQIVIRARRLISILYIPLLLKEDAIGCLIVGTTNAVRRFSQREIDLCSILAAHISMAVTNASLYEKARRAIHDLSQAYNATLEGWSHLLDIRDHITDEHTDRVTELTMKLAARFDFPPAEMEHIQRGALLHDIGKIGIPDHILQKPGPLTSEEFRIMQRHTELARALMTRIDYVAPAVNIPYCHHEKWDGSGYPRRLRGNEIPLEARIFAVVDVFDALTHDRPYRQAWEREEALAYIREHSGRHFAPNVVAAFLEMLAEEEGLS